MSTMLFTFLFMTLFFGAPFTSLAAAATTGLRATMTRIDSGSSFTLAERFQRAVRRSHRRSQLLGLNKFSSGRDVIVKTTIEWGEYEYLMSASIGTPALPITAILDTGSDLIWTQSIPCFTCLPQPSPFYDPSNSTTFSLLPCSNPYCSDSGIPVGCFLNLCRYYYSYGDGTTTQGFLGKETFAFEGTPVAGLVFGCGMVNNGNLSNSTGLIGMGRGPLSLPSQLRPQRFSYCLTPFQSTKTSTVFFGAMAGQKPLGGVVQSTPFVPNPPSSTYYYLSLQAISFGRTVLPIPRSVFEPKPDGNGGVIIDSGSFLTSLHKKAYHALRKEMVKELHLPVADVPEVDALQGYDLCFKLKGAPPPEMPELVFHFKGANMVLSWDKYLYFDVENGLLCSVIASTDDQMTILGNYQQQDMHIVYDLEAHLLSFAPAKCEQI